MDLHKSDNLIEKMPEIIVRNEPPQSEHAVDQKFNEMRLGFVPYIRQFITEHELFKRENRVGITFAQKGVSSIIAIIDTQERKLILKIPRSKTFSAGEGSFLKVWEDAGVKVPHVFEVGILHDYPYTLMEYIDAPTLDTLYSKEELLEKGLYAEMGKALRVMHAPKAEGYGFVVDGKPEFSKVEEWLNGDDMKKRLEYITENNLLGSLQNDLPNIFDVIKKHTEKENSSYCHDDFGPHNVFATDPITIFDANPKFNNRYYDLGRVKFGDISSGDSNEASGQLIAAYFGEEKYDDRVLYAYTFLACCMKFPYWHKTARKKELDMATSYFAKNKL